MSRLRFGVGVAIALCAGTWIVCGQTAHANVFAGPKSAVILADQYPSNLSPTTKDRIVTLESNCSVDLTNERNNPKWGTDREIVNAAAYSQTTWLSRAGDPNWSSSHTIPNGTTSLNLQFNQMLFLCAIVTMTDSGSTYNNPANRVTNAQYPNERGPVPDSSSYSPNMASRYESNARIYSIQPLNGGTISGGVGGVISYRRENNSRYWFANPIGFTYNLPPALQTPGTHTLTIRAEVANIFTYHDYGSAGTSRCDLKGGAGTGDVGYNSFNSCDTKDLDLTFQYTIVAPPGYACGAVNPAMTELGSAVPFTPRLNVAITYNTTPAPFRIRYTVTRPSGAAYVNGILNTTVTTSGTTTNVTSDPLPAMTPPDSGVYPVTWDLLDSGGAVLHSGCPGSFTVYRAPYLQVYGGDVQAGAALPPTCTVSGAGYKGIATFNAGSAGNYAGGGTELAAIAYGVIKDFASAQQRTTAPLKPTGLSFANTQLGTNPFGGGMGDAPCIDDYASLFPSSGVPSGPYTVTPGGATKNVASKEDVFVQGDAFVSGNIVYANNGSWNVNSIPNFRLIVKGNIYIKNTVTELHGTYVALPTGANDGRIYTCSVDGTPPSEAQVVNECGAVSLTVYGSFIAQEVKLLRTKGTIAQNTPSEVFRFSPAAWIVSGATLPQSGTAADAITALPPVL